MLKTAIEEREDEISKVREEIGDVYEEARIKEDY